MNVCCILALVVAGCTNSMPLHIQVHVCMQSSTLLCADRHQCACKQPVQEVGLDVSPVKPQQLTPEVADSSDIHIAMGCGCVFLLFFSNCVLLCMGCSRMHGLASWAVLDGPTNAKQQDFIHIAAPQLPIVRQALSRSQKRSIHFAVTSNSCACRIVPPAVRPSPAQSFDGDEHWLHVWRACMHRTTSWCSMHATSPCLHACSCLMPPRKPGQEPTRDWATLPEARNNTMEEFRIMREAISKEVGAGPDGFCDGTIIARAVN